MRKKIEMLRYKVPDSLYALITASVYGGDSYLDLLCEELLSTPLRIIII